MHYCCFFLSLFLSTCRMMSPNNNGFSCVCSSKYDINDLVLFQDNLSGYHAVINSNNNSNDNNNGNEPAKNKIRKGSLTTCII